MSVTHACALLKGLRPGSRVLGAINESLEWSIERHLQTDIIDLLNLLVWVTAHGRTKDKPKPIDRPKKKAESDILAVDTKEEYERLLAERRKKALANGK